MSPYLVEQDKDVPFSDVLTSNSHLSGEELTLDSSTSELSSEECNNRLKGKTTSTAQTEILKAQKLTSFLDTLNKHIYDNARQDNRVFSRFPEAEKMIQLSLDVNTSSRQMQFHLLDAENVHLKTVADDRKDITARVYLAKKKTLLSRATLFMGPIQEAKMKRAITLKHVGDYVINNYVLHIEIFKKCKYTQAIISLGKTSVDMKMFQTENNAVFWKSLKPVNKRKGKMARCISRLFGTK